MLSRRAVQAYCAALVLAIAALLFEIRTLRVPWLVNGENTIGLWRSTSGGRHFEFPTEEICGIEISFCAGWRTASFLFTLVLVPDILVVAALLFSWMYHHRKKTVAVVRSLLLFAIASEIVGMWIWRIAYLDIGKLLRGENWDLAGGLMDAVTAFIAQVMLLMLMAVFRPLLQTNDFIESNAESVADSETLDEDEISIPESLPPEQVDFYIFTKQARRRELARANASL